ncbi:MAG: glycosyltransferase [Bacteroidia bacterium]
MADKSSDIVLSLIIPAYKCADVFEKNFPKLKTHLQTLSCTYEVIIVDDGSNDDGRLKNIAQQLDCLYLFHEKNKGKGAAIKTGMNAACGKYKIFTDADIPYEYEAIDTMLYFLSEQKIGMVVGDRKMMRSVYFEDVSRLRNIGSKFFSYLVGTLIVGGWYDTQCGIKGFSKEAADELFSLSRIDGFAMDVELFYIALKKKYEIKRISVKLRSKDGQSVRVFLHGITMSFSLLKIIFFKLSGKYKLN